MTKFFMLWYFLLSCNFLAVFNLRFFALCCSDSTQCRIHTLDFSIVVIVFFREVGVLYTPQKVSWKGTVGIDLKMAFELYSLDQASI